MPEFTYEESDNYMAAQEASGMSAGELIKEWFLILRALKKKEEWVFKTNYSLWLSVLQTEMEKRGIMKNGRIER
jgi:hypothetical protein